MRFNCGLTSAEKHEAKKSWHRWFAWHPVRIGRDCIWLERILRRGDFYCMWGDSYWVWDYSVSGTGLDIEL